MPDEDLAFRWMVKTPSFYARLSFSFPKSALEVRLVLMHTQEAPGGNSGSQVPASQVGDVAWVSGFHFGLVQPLAVLSMWGVNKWMESLLPLHHNNKL